MELSFGIQNYIILTSKEMRMKTATFTFWFSSKVATGKPDSFHLQ
jgi:hypothetical protein